MVWRRHYDFATQVIRLPFWNRASVLGENSNIWEPTVPNVGRFRFDTGPHVLTMPWVIRDLFESLNLRMEDWIDLQRMNPICRYHFTDEPFFPTRQPA